MTNAPDITSQRPTRQEVEDIIAAARIARANEIGRLVMTIVHKLRAWFVAPIGRYLAARRIEGDLAQLDDRILADMGLNRADIHRVAIRAAANENQRAANAA